MQTRAALSPVEILLIPTCFFVSPVGEEGQNGSPRVTERGQQGRSQAIKKKKRREAVFILISLVSADLLTFSHFFWEGNPGQGQLVATGTALKRFADMKAFEHLLKEALTNELFWQNLQGRREGIIINCVGYWKNWPHDRPFHTL